jgi:acetylornithine deacetylase/succinyl-diaminopimelate desuccinylase-like protein
MNHPAVALLEELVAIHSVNPALEEGARGEAEIAAFLERRCRNKGLRVTRQPVLPGRDNLLIEVDAGKPATLLFESHMDTVPPGGMEDALRPVQRDGLLYGRGTCDTKATLAGMLYAMEQAAAQPGKLACNVALCAAVDEEYQFRGALALCNWEKPITAAVVGEPTELRIVVAHKGVARFAIKTHGKAAHSSVPHEGDSAIFQMQQVLGFIRDIIEPELAARSHPLVTPPSMVVGTIRGGTQVNIVPESCEIEVDRRLIPGEDALQVMQQFQERLSATVAGLGVNYSFRELLYDWPLNTDPEASIAQSARQVAARLDLDAGIHGVPYGSDASKLQHYRNIPAIVYGPGSIAQAHSAQEFVPVREVELAAEFYTELTRSFTG